MAASKTKKCTTRMDRNVFKFSGDMDDTPGPAAYSIKTTVGYVNRMPTVRNEPAYTFKPKLDFSSMTDGPGKMYNVRYLTRNGRAAAPMCTIGRKLVERPESNGPGPAAYRPKSVRGKQIKILLPINRLDPVRRVVPRFTLPPNVFWLFVAFFFPRDQFALLPGVRYPLSH